MPLLPKVATALRSLFARQRVEAELDEELRGLLELAVEEKMKRGISRQEAMRAVRLERGSLEVTKEEVRAAGWESFLESFCRDLGFAARLLRKSSGFTAVAVLTLALGIGANTAIFQLIDAVGMRNLPVPAPQQLAAVRIVGGNQGIGLNQNYGDLTRPLWQEIRDNQHVFSDAFAWSVAERYVGRGSEMRRFHALWVSGDFFRVLGVGPFRGRLLTPADEGPCPMSYGVASYSYWRKELGGRDPALGINLIVDNFPVQIIGVTPPEFFGMVVGDNFDIALPLCLPPDGLQRDIFEVSVVGRLKPGWSLERASAALNALSPGVFEATVPPGRDTRTTETYKNFRLGAYRASRGVNSLHDTDYTSLWLLLGITGLVLVIACANLANLMLVRGNAREREMAVRLALGAPRWRLVQQLLVEGLLLAAAGAALGVAMAEVLGRSLVLLFSTADKVLQLDLSLDWRVLLFVAGVALTTCLVFAMVPALRSSGPEPSHALKSGSRGTTADRGRFSLQQLMILMQISISVMLLAGAVLFVRSFRNLVTQDTGMREQGITIAFLGYWQSNLPPERWPVVQQELLEEVQAVPGVHSAATTTRVPLDGGSWEHGVLAGSTEASSKFAWVSPSYFATMRIPIVRGRGLSREDSATSPHVAVVNQTFVRRFFGGSDPIGQTLRTIAEPGYPATTYQIVGVIPDTRYSDLRSETPPMTFAPAAQFPAPAPWTSMVIYSSMPAPAVMAAVKRSMAEKHHEVLTEFTDFQMQILDRLVMERVMAMLSGFFGLLAALLAAIGIYGVISYIVVMRRNEIGIRMALGASRGGVLNLVLRQTALLLAAGVAIGSILALLTASGARALLYGLQPNDPATLFAAGTLLIAVSLLAALVPATRAVYLDPTVALRYE